MKYKNCISYLLAFYAICLSKLTSGGIYDLPPMPPMPMSYPGARDQSEQLLPPPKYPGLMKSPSMQQYNPEPLQMYPSEPPADYQPSAQYPSQIMPEPPGQYSPQSDQYSPQPGQYSPQPAQYSPQPAQYSPQPAQYPPKAEPQMPSIQYPSQPISPPTQYQPKPMPTQPPPPQYQPRPEQNLPTLPPYNPSVPRPCDLIPSSNPKRFITSNKYEMECPFTMRFNPALCQCDYDPNAPVVPWINGYTPQMPEAPKYK